MVHVHVGVYHGTLISGSIAHEHGRNEFTGAAGEIHNQTIPLLQHLRQQQLGHLRSNDISARLGS